MRRFGEVVLNALEASAKVLLNRGRGARISSSWQPHYPGIIVCGSVIVSIFTLSLASAAFFPSADYRWLYFPMVIDDSFFNKITTVCDCSCSPAFMSGLRRTGMQHAHFLLGKHVASKIVESISLTKII